MSWFGVAMALLWLLVFVGGCSLVAVLTSGVWMPYFTNRRYNARAKRINGLVCGRVTMADGNEYRIDKDGNIQLSDGKWRLTIDSISF